MFGYHLEWVPRKRVVTDRILREERLVPKSGTKSDEIPM